MKATSPFGGIAGAKRALRHDVFIIPKQFGDKHAWENLVCACVRCNNRKGNRTPEQANMKLMKKPNRPSYLFFLQFFIEKPHDSWKPYLFLN